MLELVQRALHDDYCLFIENHLTKEIIWKTGAKRHVLHTSMHVLHVPNDETPISTRKLVETYFAWDPVSDYQDAEGGVHALAYTRHAFAVNPKQVVFVIPNYLRRRRVVCTPVIDMTPYTAKREGVLLYMLHAVCVHTGANAHAGHYTYWRRNATPSSPNERWQCVDDETRTVHSSLALSERCSPYVLIYRQIALHRATNMLMSSSTRMSS